MIKIVGFLISNFYFYLQGDPSFQYFSSFNLQKFFYDVYSHANAMAHVFMQCILLLHTFYFQI